MDLGTVFVFHGGQFEEHGVYVGGKCLPIHKIDFEGFIQNNLDQEVRKLGYNNFILQGRRQNAPGFISLCSDESKVEFSILAKRDGFCEVFVQHIQTELSRPIGDDFFRCIMDEEVNDGYVEFNLTEEDTQFHGGEEDAEEHDVNAELDEGEENEDYIGATWDDDEVMSGVDEEMEEILRNRGRGKSKSKDDDVEEEWGLPKSDTHSGNVGETISSNRVFNPNCKPHEIVFEAGLIFTNKEEFKKALTDFSVYHSTSIRIVKSDKRRLQARCQEGCPWYIWAAVVSEGDPTWQIKSYNNEHICGETFNHRGLVTYKWIADKFQNKMHSKTKDIMTYAMEDHQVGVSINKCEKAKKHAMNKILGVYKVHFSKLRDYCHELLRSNPNSTVKLQCYKRDVTTFPRFERLYIFFDALKQGFKRHCRRVIGLDGTFLKGFTKGLLLVAVAKDSNDQMYPLAWAIVEVECKASWCWFVGLLRGDLDTRDGHGCLFIITDQQKGLVDAIATLMPAAEHRCCSMHVYCNWKEKNKGKELQMALWRCAIASTVTQLETALEAVKVLDKRAAEDLVKCDPKKWSRAYFSDTSKSAAVENNMAECFNWAIDAARYKPVISCLEKIRTYTFERLGKQKSKAMAWRDFLGPNIREKVNRMILRSSQFFVRSNCSMKFECYNNRNMSETYCVDLAASTCACRYWQLSGIPCPHASAVLREMRKRPEDVVHSVYRVENQLQLYNYVLMPVNGEAFYIMLLQDFGTVFMGSTCSKVLFTENLLRTKNLKHLLHRP